MAYRLGVDIGGTFTDFCVLDESKGAIHALKVFSAPDAPGTEITKGLDILRDRHGIHPKDIRSFTHGTTVGINTIIQRDGARLAMLATENFTDLLELARLRLPEAFSLYSIRPRPLVTKDCVFGIRERMLADGSVATPLDRGSVSLALESALGKNVEGIVICFLHAYKNAEHELVAKAIVQELAPQLPVVCSSEIWPVIREYERSVTTVLNGYIQPRVAAYLTAFEDALRQKGVPARPLVTKTNGGVMAVEEGKVSSVNMVLSGTASGVMGAAFVAGLSDVKNAITLDIGGTSADVALVIDGKPQYGMGEKIGDFPLYVPSVSVASIGEGGGSVAWTDEFGVLKVGPESAGSTPGPACFNRGGTKPTITDAFAVCGFLGAGDLGYGSVTVDIEKAREAVGQIADTMGLSVEVAAESIIRIAISGMYVEINKIFAKNGVDPDDFSLLAFGGAGPMMACFLARELGMKHVLVPSSPGVISALGGLIADMKNDFIQTLYMELNDRALTSLTSAFRELEERARVWLAPYEAQVESSQVVLSADMHYKGQSFEIEVPIDAAWIASGDIEAIKSAFHRQHELLYGLKDEASRIHLVSARLVILGHTPKPSLATLEPGEKSPEAAATIRVWLDGDWMDIPVYRRTDFFADTRFAGPCVIVQSDTTTCIPPGYTGRVDHVGGLHLTRV